MSAADLLAEDRGLRAADNIMAIGFKDPDGTDSDAPGARKLVTFLRNPMRFKAAPGSEEEWVTIDAREMLVPLWRANEMAAQGMGSIVRSQDSPNIAPSASVSPEIGTKIPDSVRIDHLESKMDRIIAILEKGAL